MNNSKQKNRIRLNFHGFVVVNGEPNSEREVIGEEAKLMYRTLEQSPNYKLFAKDCKIYTIKEIIYQNSERKINLNYQELGKHLPPRAIRRTVEDIN